MSKIYKINHVINNKTSNKTLKNEWEKITMLLMPLTPHLAHECCEKINKKIATLHKKGEGDKKLTKPERTELSRLNLAKTFRGMKKK